MPRKYRIYSDEGPRMFAGHITERVVTDYCAESRRPESKTACWAVVFRNGFQHYFNNFDGYTFHECLQYVCSCFRAVVE